MDIKNIRRVALDGNQWMTSMLKIHFREHLEKQNSPVYEWTEKDDAFIVQDFKKDALLFTMKWMSIGITPVWIIDGKSPVAKDQQKMKRQKAKDSAKRRFDELITRKNDKTILQQQQQQQEDTEGKWIADDIDSDSFTDEERRKLISYRQQEKALTSYFVNELKTFLSLVGIPYIQAVDEGERLACMLYHDKLVDAVFSTDTDCLVYKCKHVITQFFVEASQYMPVYNYDSILNSLELTEDQFTEFCILLGNDFNTNIAKIGPVKSLELIQMYKSIKELPNEYKKIKIDKDILNYDICKSIFNIRSSIDLCASPVLLDVDIEKMSKTELPFNNYITKFIMRELPLALSRYREIGDTRQQS